MLYVNHTNTRS